MLNLILTQHTLMCVCVKYVCMHGCAHEWRACIGQRITSLSQSSGPFHLVFETGSFIGLELQSIG